MNSPSISRVPDLPITSLDALTTEIHKPKWKTTKILSSTERLDLIGDGIQISLNKGLFIWRRASPVSGLARFTEILALHTFFVKKLIEFIWLGGLARLPRSRLAMPRSRQAGWKNSHIKHAIPVTGLKIIILRMSSSLIKNHLLYKIVSFSQNISKNSLISPQLINFPHYNDSIELKY